MLVFSVRSTVSIAPQRCVFSRCTLFLRERRYHAAFYPARVRFSPQHSHLPRPGASPPLECAWSRCRLSTVASELGSASEVEELIAWRSSFTRDSIPYRSFAVQHARSSGPGGQNVNKVNTKVDVRFVLDDAQWLPGLIKKVLRRTEARRINSKGEFVMTSERQRTQDANLTDCVDKIFDCLVRAAELDGVTSPETKQRIEKMKVRANERRLQDKKMRSSRREGRGRGGGE